MNERILELIKQADGYEIRMVMTNGKQYTFLEDDLEKFAELIVKECVQSIEKTIETNCDTDSEKMGCEFAITDLLEHFGVEE